MFDRNPLCGFVRQLSPIAAYNESKVHQLTGMAATYGFYPMDPTIWVSIDAFSRAAVKWKVNFFNFYCLFSYETYKISNKKSLKWIK